jgi:gamma-glutamyltranspeptidase/glutathione hydrolase
MQNLVVLSLVLALISCSTTQQAPNVSSVDSVSRASEAMVVTANPHASKAGADILRAGGSAVDAAVAIEAVLSLVEPQSSGLGGGGFLVHFDNSTKEMVVYDGRETAPALVRQDMFLTPQGESIGYLNAKNSGLATGVPGMVAMLEMAHSEHGKLPWSGLFTRATELANKGFKISPRLQSFIVRLNKYIPKTLQEGPLEARKYFYDADNEPLQVGDVRTNLAYAKTLEMIAADPNSFYSGPIAEEIVQQVSRQPRAGTLSLDDMQAYRALKREPICTPYKEKKLCGPQPSSSWLAVGAIMGILNQAPKFSLQGAQDPQNWAIFAEAQRLAYADRDHFVADNLIAKVPTTGLLDPIYLKHRASLISEQHPIESVTHGDPWAFQEGDKVAVGVDATQDFAGTSHFVVVDAQGNVVSMTASVESVFGTTRMAGGMFLNNQLTDFSFRSKDEQGTLIANRVQAGKRPRSSMSPTIVLDQDGEFYLATGSPGGNSIIAYTAKSLVGVLEWGLSPQQAVNLPNLVARGDKVRIEKERADQSIIDGLRSYGYEVKESAGENSGLSVVLRNSSGILQGGVDPRREGIIERVKPQPNRQ